MDKLFINIWRRLGTCYSSAVNTVKLILVIGYLFAVPAYGAPTQPPQANLQESTSSPSVQLTAPKELIIDIENNALEKVKKHIRLNPNLVDACEIRKESEDECLSLLIPAIEFGNIAMVELLLSLGVNPNGKVEGSNRGRPLIMSTFADHYGIFTKLLAAGADPIDSRIRNGIDPLMAASLMGRVHYVARLLRLGADPHRLSPGDKQLNAFDMAKRGGHEHLIPLLEQPTQIQAKLDEQLKTAVLEGERWQAQTALAGGAQPDLLVDGHPLILHALFLGQQAIAELLLEYQADLNQVSPEGETLLVNLLYTENYDDAQWLLEKGASPNGIPDATLTPLIAAVIRRNYDWIEKLLEAGAKVDQANDKGFTAIDFAFGLADRQAALLLMGAGAKFSSNMTDSTHTISKVFDTDFKAVLTTFDGLYEQHEQASDQLIAAAKNSNKKQWQAAISNGADISTVDNDGYSALDYAAINNDILLADTLIARGANLERKNDLSPLMEAAKAGSLDVANALIEAGAKRDYQLSDGQTALDIAKENNRRAVTELLQGIATHSALKRNEAFITAAGADPKQQNEAEAIKLLQQGADPNWSSGTTWPALHYAARDGLIDLLVELLQTERILVEPEQFGDWTPLQLAAYNGQSLAVIHLLKAGADVHKTNAEGKDALQLAEQNEHLLVQQILTNTDDLDLFKSATELLIAADTGNESGVYQALKSGVMPDIKDNNGWLPIDYAVRNGSIRSVELLLKAGSSFDHWVPTDEGLRTPLMLASHNGYFEIAHHLIKQGADKNQVSIKQETALSIAEQNHRAYTARLLRSPENKYEQVFQQETLNIAFLGIINKRMERTEQGASPHSPSYLDFLFKQATELLNEGANPDTEYDDGWRAIHLAARDGDLNMVKLLLDKGANPEHTLYLEGNVYSPIDLAAYNGRTEIVSILQKATSNKALHASAVNYAKSNQQFNTVLFLEHPDEFAARHLQEQLIDSVIELLKKEDVSDSDLNKVKKLLASGGSREKTDYRGLRPVDHLLLSDRAFPELIKELLPGVDTAEYPEQVSDVYLNSLMLAIKGQNLHNIATLLELGHNPEAQTQSGHNALQWAELQQNQNALKLLKAPSQNRIDILNGAQLTNAIAKGDAVSTIRWLNTPELDVGITDQHGYTPLHYTAAEGYITWTNTLLDRNADINTPDSNGMTPLSLAAKFGQLDIVKLLLKRGADKQLTDTERKTAQDHAANGGHLKIVMLLAADNPEDLPTVWQRFLAIDNAVRIQNISILQDVLRDLPNEVLTLDFTSRTPLHRAAELNDLLSLNALLQAGFSANSRDNLGKTPLMLAAEQSEEAVALLMAYGALPQLTDKTGIKAEDHANNLKDSTLREKITDRLALSISKPRELLEQRMQQHIQRHLPLEDLSSIKEKGIANLVNSALEYANQTAFNELLNYDFSPTTELGNGSALDSAIRLGQTQNVLKLWDMQSEEQKNDLNWQREVLNNALDQHQIAPALSFLTLPEFNWSELSDDTEWVSSWLEHAKGLPPAQCSLINPLLKGNAKASNTLDVTLRDICTNTYPEISAQKADLVLSIGHQESISTLAVQSNSIDSSSRWLASGDESGTVIIWEQETSKALTELKLSDEKIHHLSFADKKPWLLITTETQIWLWDIPRQRVHWQKKLPHSKVLLDDEHLWIADEKNLYLLSLEQGQLLSRKRTYQIDHFVSTDTGALAINGAGTVVHWDNHLNQLSSHHIENNPYRSLLLRWHPVHAKVQLIGLHKHNISKGNKLTSYSLNDGMAKPTQEIDWQISTGITINEGFPWTVLSSDSTQLVLATSDGLQQLSIEEDESPTLHPAIPENGGRYTLESKEYKKFSLSAEGKLIHHLWSRNTQKPYFKMLPIVSRNPTESKGEEVFWFADNRTLKRYRSDGTEADQWSGNANKSYGVCKTGNNGLIFNSSLGKNGIKLSDRGLPSLHSIIDNNGDWLCNDADRYDVLWNQGLLQLINRDTNEVEHQIDEFDSIIKPNILFNPMASQLIAWGRQLSNNSNYISTADIIVYDLNKRAIVHRIHPFKDESFFNKKIKSLSLDESGRWLLTSNGKKVISFDLQAGVIAQTENLKNHDITLVGDLVWILGSDLSAYKIEDIKTPIITHELDFKPDHSSQLTYLNTNTLVISNERSLFTFDTNSNNFRRLNGSHEGDIYNLIPYSDSIAITSSTDASIGFWDVEKGLQAKLIPFKDGNWAVISPDGLFDASPAGMSQLYFRIADNLIDLEQLKNRYFEPNLLQKVLSYHREPLRDTQHLNHVALFPQVKLTKEKQEGLFSIELLDQGGGIGKLLVHLNGKLVTLNNENSLSQLTESGQQWQLDLTQHRFLKPQDNELRVTAFNADGYLSSRGARVSFKSQKLAPVERPKLYVVSIGVSDYKGGELDLRFAAKDAADMEKALTIGAKRLFGVEQTESWLLSTESQSPDHFPTKENIAKVFTDIAAKAQSQDILVLYLSGHGISLGGAEGNYHFLTADAYTSQASAYLDPAITASSTLSSQDMIELVNQTAILKQVLILDTCASGQVVENLAEKRDLSSGTLRALEKVQSRTGMHVITGSTADAVSYEASQYGQGLLTYSLLEGIKGAALQEEKFVDVVNLFSHARDRVPELAEHIGGIQQPVTFSKADSFYIGQMQKDDKSQIKLTEPKPVLLMSTFMNVDTFDDNLNLETLMDEQFRELSARGRQAPLIFVDARTYPNGWRLRGTYEEESEQVQLSAVLFYGSEKIKRIQATSGTNEIASLITQLTQETQSAIKATQ